MRGVVQVSSRCHRVTSALPATPGHPHVECAGVVRGVAEVSSRCHPVTSAPFSRVRQLNLHVGCAGVVRSVGVKSPLRHGHTL
jgi:hypothetical protein